MNMWRVVKQSFVHYWRTNLAILFGVAIATAVLSGALIVGESMRTSLRDLTLDRLGHVDELLTSQGFFRELLADDIAKTPTFQEYYDAAVPAILFNNGTVEIEVDGKVRRVANVNVFGVTKDFWSLDDNGFVENLAGESVVLNQALADELSLQSDSDFESEVVVRIPKPTQLPAESALGATDDLVESFVGLAIKQVIPDQGLGRFGLHPSQVDGPNLYLPIELLQDALARKALKHKADWAQANLIFLSGKDGQVPPEDARGMLLAEMRPTLQDYGLVWKAPAAKFKDQTIFDYWSISSEQLVLSEETGQVIQKTFPAAKPLLTYLANDIRRPDEASGIPFSMITSIDFDKQFQPLSAISGNPISPIGENEIVLNEWAASDLGNVKIGEAVEVAFFEAETTHGNQVEKSVSLVVVDIAKLTEPRTPFEFRSGKVELPEFDTAPTLANDPDLTPEVPGVTDARSIANWDLPFDTAGKIRSQDDDYWEYYRTTPKGFVSLETGQKLWGSRFGRVTSFRVPNVFQPESGGNGIPAKYEMVMAFRDIEERLLTQLNESESQLAFLITPIKQQGIAASSGSTPFDGLFLALSMFVILSALFLVSLLFRLALQSRISEVGLLQAIGWTRKKIFGIWMREMVLVCVIGSILGVLLGVGYAALMIHGLKTWWLGAISKPFIELHVGPLSTLVGLFSGILICVGTIWWSLRQIRKEPTIGLLAGRLESASSPNGSPRGKRNRSWLNYFVVVLFVVAVGLSFLATSLSGDAQAGSFMGSGFCVLAGLLICVFLWLKSPSADGERAGLSLAKIASLSNSRNPLRSTLTIGLVAVASFLIAAVSSFRLTPTESGTAGFDYIGQTSQAIFADLNSIEDQKDLFDDEALLPSSTTTFGFRLKPGQDASCNNLYQATQPKVLGVPQAFIDRFDDSDLPSFAWGGSVAESDSEKANPWRLLDRKFDDAIPVVIDKNTANYSLKIFAPGGTYEVDFDSGESVKFHVVGFLSNTILQGGLLISESDFKKLFPYIGGQRYFLIETGTEEDSQLAKSEAPLPEAISTLESQLGDQGFDAQSASRLLARFMSVQNTYLSTFQSLGALGLLLGTFGLAAVQMRSVLERKKELGLLRAVGFRQSRLSRMILLENAWLLFVGLAIGVLAALCSTLPHYLFGDASVPWLPLAVILGTIVIVGLVTSFLATRMIGRVPLLESLR